MHQYSKIAREAGEGFSALSRLLDNGFITQDQAFRSIIEMCKATEAKTCDANCFFTSHPVLFGGI